MDFIRDRLVEYQKNTGNFYNLEATPAEGTTRRFATLDKEKYPDIICGNEEEYKKGAVPFYTNSTMLPVNYTDDIFEALDHQDGLQAKYTGGTVMHIFCGEKDVDPVAVKNLIWTICSKYTIPYVTFTPTFSVCPNDGYVSGEMPICPKCGSNCEVYSRVVGYLRPVSNWNDSKQQEFKQRKTYKI